MQLQMSELNAALCAPLLQFVGIQYLLFCEVGTLRQAFYNEKFDIKQRLESKKSL